MMRLPFGLISDKCVKINYCNLSEDFIANLKKHVKIKWWNGFVSCNHFISLNVFVTYTF